MGCEFEEWRVFWDDCDTGEDEEVDEVLLSFMFVQLVVESTEYYINTATFFGLRFITQIKMKIRQQLR